MVEPLFCNVKNNSTLYRYISDMFGVCSYFILEPVNYGFDQDGKAYWTNQNPNEKQLRETFKVSPETLERALKGFEII